jgi:hypothetical protein
MTYGLHIKLGPADDARALDGMRALFAHEKIAGDSRDPDRFAPGTLVEPLQYILGEARITE